MNDGTLESTNPEAGALSTNTSHTPITSLSSLRSLPPPEILKREDEHEAVRLERAKTLKEIQDLDKELPATHKIDTEGKHMLQRSVFEWINDDGSGFRGRTHQTITAAEVAERWGIPERHLIKYLRDEETEAEACKMLPFTLILVCSFSTMAIAHDNATAVRSIEDSLEVDILDNANWAFHGDYVGHKNMDDVDNFAEFWSWMRVGMVPLLWEPHYSEGFELHPNFTEKTTSTAQRGYWLHFNRVVGGLRMVQERDFPDENELVGKIREAPYGNVLVDKIVRKSRECTTLSILHDLYNKDCVGGMDYDLEPELGIPNERAKRTVHPQRAEWLYIFKEPEDILDKLTKLELSSWLDSDTKKVEISIASYNGEFGVHTLTRINFYFSRGGHIWKLIIPSSQFADWHDRWYYIVYDAIWLCCIAYIAVSEIFEIQAVVRIKGPRGIWKDYLNLWNVADWTAVVGGLAIVCVFLASIGMRTKLNDLLSELGNTPSTDWETDGYKTKLNDYVEKLAENCNYVRYLRLALALYPTFIIIRLFKSFAAQPKLALVTRTLSCAMPDLLHFSIVFASVFVTFAICSNVLFGKELRAFTTAARSLLTCFRVMLGDVSWEDLSAIGRAEAMIWLWFFIIIIPMLMLNMILAIIMDNYEMVKSEIGGGETLLEEAVQLYVRSRGIRNGTYVPLDIVLEALEAEATKRRLARTAHAPHLSRMFSFFESSVSKNASASDSLGRDSGNFSAILQSESSKTHWEEGGLKHDRTGDVIITAKHLIKVVRGHHGKMKPSYEQAIEIIEGALEDFHSRHKDSNV